MRTTGISVWGEAGRWIVFATIMTALGCAGAGKPPASEVQTEHRAPGVDQELTIQSMAIVDSGSIWRGMISEPLLEDERRGLYVPDYPTAQENFHERVEEVLGTSVPLEEFEQDWIERWQERRVPIAGPARQAKQVPHLTLFLVETWIQHFGFHFDLSAVVVPAETAESGASLIVFDDFVIRDVEIMFENEWSGDVKARVPRFVIDRMDYPPGSRHYVYTRKIGRWGQGTTLPRITDEMLRELKADLVRDGFLSR